MNRNLIEISTNLTQDLLIKYNKSLKFTKSLSAVHDKGCIVRHNGTDRRGWLGIIINTEPPINYPNGITILWLCTNEGEYINTSQDYTREWAKSFIQSGGIQNFTDVDLLFLEIIEKCKLQNISTPVPVPTLTVATSEPVKEVPVKEDQFIVWGQKSTSNPKMIEKSFASALEAAETMTERDMGKFYVAKLVAVSEPVLKSEVTIFKEEDSTNAINSKT